MSRRIEIVIGEEEVTIFASRGISSARWSSKELSRLMNEADCAYMYAYYVCRPKDKARWLRELVLELRKFYRNIVVRAEGGEHP